MISDTEIIKVEYVTFNNLAELRSQDIDYVLEKLIKQLEDSNWLTQYETVNFIRRLNKFDKILFEKIFDKALNTLIKLSSSIRSNLSKVVLLLFGEIFYCDNFNAKWLKLIIPAILTQSASTKGFIREEALLCLDNIANSKSKYEFEIITTLSDEIMNKNVNISENSLNCLLKFLKQCDINLCKNEWNTIINKNIAIYNLIKDMYTKKAIRLLNVYISILGDEINNIGLNHESISKVEKMQRDSIKFKK